MAHESDYLVDRRRLKRHLTFWRIVSVVSVVAAISLGYGGFKDTLGGREFIARIAVEGVIVHDDDRIQEIRKLGDNDAVKAVIVRINSPGGTVFGGETLHKALLSVGKKKPLVAVLDGIATSAAYMTAIATDRIFASEGTLTGSIGVIFQTTEITKLLEKVGVSAQSFKSGFLKAAPSPLEPVTPKIEMAIQALVTEMYQMFKDMVLRRRDMSLANVEKFSDGRVFTGRQALQSGLVDQIGGEEEARSWLAEERGVAADLEIRTVRLQHNTGDLPFQVKSLVRKAFFSEPLTLDGIISVWHPKLP